MTAEPTGPEILETLLFVASFAEKSLSAQIKRGKGKEKRWMKDQRRAIREITQRLLTVDATAAIVHLDLSVDDWQVISVPLVGVCNACEKMKAENVTVPKQLSDERLGVLLYAVKTISDWDRGYINPPVIPTARA